MSKPASAPQRVLDRTPSQRLVAMKDVAGSAMFSSNNQSAD
jgi:hypothetical protein